MQTYIQEKSKTKECNQSDVVYVRSSEEMEGVFNSSNGETYHLSSKEYYLNLKTNFYSTSKFPQPNGTKVSVDKLNQLLEIRIVEMKNSELL